MTDITIRDSVEEERGCGYRQGGGKYLMGGTLNAPCGKLPLKCDRCPCCDHGIKPSRGWTWVDPRMWFGKLECKYEIHGACKSCTLGGALPEKAGILWIGEKFYPTPADFAREAQTMGMSRRISQLPKDLVMGETLVLLAHRKGIAIVCPVCQGDGREELETGELVECKKCNAGTETVYAPAIFSAFVPTHIEYIVKGDETKEQLERLVKRGFQLVNVIEKRAEEPKQIDLMATAKDSLNA